MRNVLAEKIAPVAGLTEKGGETCLRREEKWMEEGGGSPEEE
jgi:hypothetical protein